MRSTALSAISVAATLVACSSTPPPRIPPVPNAIYSPERTAPAPTDDEVVITRKSTGNEDRGRTSEHASQGAVPRTSSLVVDISSLGVTPASMAPLAEQQVHMVLLRDGYPVMDRAIFGAELRDRAEAASRDGPREIDLADVLRAAREEPFQAEFVLKIRRVRVVQGEAQEIELATLADVREFMARNPGLEIPEKVEVPTMVAHADADLVEVETGRILWAGSVSADLIDALGEDAKIRIACTRSVTNGDAVAAAVRAHNARVAEADALAKERWRMLAQAHDRGLGEKDIASRRADFDEAVALVKSLEQPPADVEAPWEYVYNSQFEFTGDLGDDAVSAPAREGLLIRHVVRILLATLPST